MGMQEVAIKMSLDAQSVVSSAQNISDAFSQITEKMKEAQEAGNMDLVGKYASQAKNLQGLYNGMASEKKEPTTTGKAIQHGTSTIKGIGNTIDSAVNQLGSSGNVFGATLSGAKSGLDIIGSLGDKAAKVAGFMGLGLLPGMLINTLSGFYEQQMKPAMGINALLKNTEANWLTENQYNKLKDPNKHTKYNSYSDGKTNWYVETDKERQRINTENINKAFESVSVTATKLGYSMEEGMEVVKKATQHGYTNDDIYKIEERILKWNSATEVDTGILSNYLGRQYRFSNGTDGNSLAQAFEVNNQMGMEKGQFSETLEALKNIFENGISKGFVKSTSEIGATLATLYKASNNSKIWEGKEGANRYMQMSNAIAGATALNSVTDILTYRATAMGVSEEAKKRALQNAKIQGRYGYIDNMIFMEQGAKAELLVAQREAVKNIAGENNKKEQIELYRQMYGLNYTGATQVLEMLKNINPDNEKDIEEKIKKMQGDPKYLSDQKALLSQNEKMRYEVANIGKTASEIKYKLNNMVIALGGIATGKHGLKEAFRIMGRGKDELILEFASSEELKNEMAKLKAEKKTLTARQQAEYATGVEKEKERARNGTRSEATNVNYHISNNINDEIQVLNQQIETIEDEINKRAQAKPEEREPVRSYYEEDKKMLAEAIKDALETATITIRNE